MKLYDIRHIADVVDIRHIADAVTHSHTILMFKRNTGDRIQTSVTAQQISYRTPWKLSNTYMNVAERYAEKDVTDPGGLPTK